MSHGKLLKLISCPFLKCAVVRKNKTSVKQKYIKRTPNITSLNNVFKNDKKLDVTSLFLRCYLPLLSEHWWFDFRFNSYGAWKVYIIKIDDICHFYYVLKMIKIFSIFFSSYVNEAARCLPSKNILIFPFFMRVGKWKQISFSNSPWNKFNYYIN